MSDCRRLHHRQIFHQNVLVFLVSDRTDRRTDGRTDRRNKYVLGLPCFKKLSSEFWWKIWLVENRIWRCDDAPPPSKRTRKTKFGPTFYVFYCVCLSVCLSVLSETKKFWWKIWLVKKQNLTMMQSGVCFADHVPHRKTKFGPTFPVLGNTRARAIPEPGQYPSQKISMQKLKKTTKCQFCISLTTSNWAILRYLTFDSKISALSNFFQIDRIDEFTEKGHSRRIHQFCRFGRS